MNALLNYYAVTAAKCDIDTKWDIELPENISVADPDLCTLVGNLIENAIAGCQTLETGRYHQLSVTVRNDVNLYIVSTNSFDGNVKIKDGHYQSLKHSYGIGINSIEMTAEKYRGSTRFHHEGNEFYADVMLTVNSDYETSDLRKH